MGDTNRKMVGQIYKGNVFVFEGFERCHFNDDFIDKGSQAFYMTLDDDSIFVHVITSTHKRITKSYRNANEFLKVFYPAEKENEK